MVMVSFSPPPPGAKMFVSPSKGVIIINGGVLSTFTSKGPLLAVFPLSSLAVMVKKYLPSGATAPESRMPSQRKVGGTSTPVFTARMRSMIFCTPWVSGLSSLFL
jgi:hypothetical protein